MRITSKEVEAMALSIGEADLGILPEPVRAFIARGKVRGAATVHARMVADLLSKR